MKFTLLSIFFILLTISCNKNEQIITEPEINGQTIINELSEKYEQLPEKEIALSLDGRIYAQYSMPTDKYKHGILGDNIEATQLVVVVDNVFYEHTLTDNYVFEDLRPRLYDVDNDNILEFITIRSNVNSGAGIVIYKIVEKRLVEYSKVTEIGRSYRWLNIVTINDIDNDGVVELVWIETPHIGGILKVAKISEGTMKVLDSASKFSNHAIGERNLCLSVLTQSNINKVFYVPNQSRDKIAGFTFHSNKLQLYDEIDKNVDFSIPLTDQHEFNDLLDDSTNCINSN